ncbi:hypothetical protein J6590_039166 [Homalodisca vitripennis]|nr:hypothetical protein J6590_039166 [Homalodisca vitripennis]
MCGASIVHKYTRGHREALISSSQPRYLCAPRESWALTTRTRLICTRHGQRNEGRGGGLTTWWTDR